MKFNFLGLPLAASALSGLASAQSVRVNINNAGYGTDVSYASAFDKGTLAVFKARIVGISKTPGTKAGEASDYALLVQPFSMAPDRYGKERMILSAGYVSVELGPSWFVEDQTTKLHLEDSVEITGSRMVMGGLDVVIAETVRHGHTVLALRRTSGEPYWYAFRNKSYAGASAPPTQAQDTNPPVQQQEDYRNWNQPVQVGPSTIYGSAWTITPPGALQGGGTGRPGINSVIILGNPYWNGPTWWRF